MSQSVAKATTSGPANFAELNNDLYSKQGTVATAGGDLAVGKISSETYADAAYYEGNLYSFVDTDAVTDADSVTPDGDANVESRQDADAWLEKFSPEPDVEVVASGFDLDALLESESVGIDDGSGVTTREFQADLNSNADIVDAPGFQGAFAGVDTDTQIDQTAVSSNAQAYTKTKTDGDAQRANLFSLHFRRVRARRSAQCIDCTQAT